MKYLATIFLLILNSCSFNTEISYRMDKDDEYCRSNGFMINCRIDGRYLTVGTYTPNSCGEDFYYGYLHGEKTDRKLKITSLKLFFIETADTVSLHEIKKGRDYYYTSKKLDEIIESNKRLKITVYLKDMVTRKDEVKEFILKRHKNTYHNGTFPHS